MSSGKLLCLTEEEFCLTCAKVDTRHWIKNGIHGPVGSVLNQICLADFSILIKWMSIFERLKGVWCIFFFHSIF